MPRSRQSPPATQPAAIAEGEVPQPLLERPAPTAKVTAMGPEAVKTRPMTPLEI